MNNVFVKFAEEMSDAIYRLSEAACSEMKLEEIAGQEDVGWLELLNRLPEGVAEKYLDELMRSNDGYDAYYADDICPGGPCA